MRRPRKELPHLGLTGVVNAEKWQQMDEDTRRAWVETNANVVLSNLVQMDPMKDPYAETVKLYDVTARYTLLDSRYIQRGEVMYQLEWSMIQGAIIINQN